jgi:hypothetical protein
MARTAGSATRNDGSAIRTVTPIDISGGPAGNVNAGFRSGRLWGALVIVEFFNLLSAVGGGVALVTSRGLGMPLSLLERSPFDSFTGPGIILAVVVGGTHATAIVFALVNRRLALAAAAVAAFGMILWIYVEVSILLVYHWLQTVYFVAGIAQLVIVLLLLGVLPKLPGAVRAGPRAE